MQREELNPIAAMIELRKRILQGRKRLQFSTDSFWYTAQGKEMEINEIRQTAKHLLQDAGIRDSKPYHIKHAAITWLDKQGIPSDQLIRFVRHAQSSTTYMEYYLSEDQGAECTQVIERTVLEKESGKGGVWESTSENGIDEDIEREQRETTSSHRKKYAPRQRRRRHSVA
jgi:integrase